MLQESVALRWAARAFRACTAIFLGFAQLTFLTPTPAQAQSCEFVLGFGELRNLVGPAIVGDCLGNQQFAENGDAFQHTTGGMLVWRSADNWTAFTDGNRTWLNGPNGLQSRLNSELFPWEGVAEGAADGAAGGQAIATEVPVQSPRPPVEIQFDWFSASVNGVSPHGHHAAYVKPGDEIVARVNASATHEAVLLIDIELHDHGPDGYGFGTEAERTKVWQMSNPAFTFPANTSVTLEERFIMPNLPPGRYRVHLGVFTPDWQHMIAWDDYVGFLEVSAAG